MGLIDKAIGEIDDAHERHESLDILAGAHQFDLNLAAMQARGIYSPDAASANQALELRAIKRRLLRRLGRLYAANAQDKSFQSGGRRHSIVLVTSTKPGEGKSFTSVNLAMSLAFEDNFDTVLIDGDPVRPTIRGYFGLPFGRGLTDRLSNPQLPLSDIAWRARQARLTVIGEGAPTEAAPAIFASEEATRFFTQLSAYRRDRLVVLDAPPVLAATETLSLARHADQIVFVVQADETPEPAVASALDEILEINPNVSLVLNRCLLPAGGAHYDSYDYSYRKMGERVDKRQAAARGV